MSTRNISSETRSYIHAISQTLASGKATEHSHRPALKELIQGLGKDVEAINEPSQEKYGAPDLIINCRGIPIGHIECKNIGANLNDIENNEQLMRYRDALPNLILTDYLEFRWYTNGEFRDSARIGHKVGQDKVAIDKYKKEDICKLFDKFLTADIPTIKKPDELARRMAAKTKLLRDSISLVLKDKSESESLWDLLVSYRKVLIANLSVKQFSDMQAQTATYGLFAARCLHENSDEPFTRMSAIFANTTPFLKNIFNRLAGPDAHPRIAWIIDDIALLLERTNMEEILEGFMVRSKGHDPVVHFYEDFLAAYDPELREMRGVYYTPEPVVSYIVKSVDKLLQECFDFTDGLAHDAEYDNSGRQVLILDPAVGTGSFLREVISHIRQTITKNGLGGAWKDFVIDDLLPRLFGFELLMAPYAICHLKLAIELGESDKPFMMPKDKRLEVFLTNTLEEAHEQTAGMLFAAKEITKEASSADAIKRDKPVMVIIGNPPYSGHSANKGPWITKLIDLYKRDFPELQKPGQAKWLSDDYVKFIRFAQWRIERTGEGVLGFITNHSYLDNPTFRGMRSSLMKTFDKIYLLDLHGNANKRERTPDGGKDENVFDIKQGVVIGLFVKCMKNTTSKNDGEDNDKPAEVFHADLWGDRENDKDGGKYGWLARNDVKTTKWSPLEPVHPLYLFVPRDNTFIEEYEEAWSIQSIFSLNGDPAPGIVTTHDKFAISWTTEEAEDKVKRFLETESETEARGKWKLCSQDQWQYDKAKEELSKGKWKERIVPILYRPFDTRVTVYDRHVAVHRRDRVMRHMMAGPNLGISTTKSIEIMQGWEHALVSNSLIQHHTVSMKEVNYLFPLYIYVKDKQADFGKRRDANLNPEFIRAVCDALDYDFISDGAGNLENDFGPEDIFHYIYAVFHSPEYRLRYADFLKSDFPRVPMTKNKELFFILVGFGQILTALHLMKTEGSDLPAFPIEDKDLTDKNGKKIKYVKNKITKIEYVPPSSEGKLGLVKINKGQYFEGIDSETWNFSIGGYQPAEKWLTDHKGKVLSFGELKHYRRICAALSETQKIMKDIDAAIETHGGWPLS